MGTPRSTGETGMTLSEDMRVNALLDLLEVLVHLDNQELLK